jgi:hypothetical protein
LKTYINQHQHLPGLPTAAEVADTGLDVGEMNRLLVEKVEELTLHVIKLQEQVNQINNTKKGKL